MRVPGRVVLAMLVSVSCGGADVVAPRVGPPAFISVTTAPTPSVTVGAAAGTMTVRVTDASGAAVAGALVRFSAGVTLTVAPDTARTDAAGEARTVVLAGTTSGAATVAATVGGTNLIARASVFVAAGPAVLIVVTPKTARVYYVGDTVRFTAVALDRYGNRLTVDSLRFATADSSLLRVDASGVVTALRPDGVSAVIASAGPHNDTATVSVTAAGVTPCTGVAVPSGMAVGALATFSGVSSGCISGAASGAEYALVAFNGARDGSVSLSATITPTGLTSAPTSPLDALAPSASALVPLARGASVMTLVPDEAFHLRLRERAGATVRARANGARRWYATRPRARTRTSISGFDVAPSYSAIPASPSVGDIVRVNVNANRDCTSPAYRGARVAAISSKAIVLADTLNPANGFSDADFARYAARFDTLVYPLAASAFGVPTDIDGNGRVAILFTRAVNELTPPGASSFVAGFFYGRDLLPATGAGACAGSNEGELLYMLVPDAAGVVNGNVRRIGFVDSMTTGVLAHEMQHLINSSRRLYVNQGAATEEAVWLNEGLSHVAEELLYYRESGKLPRSNLGDDAIRVSAPASYEYFKTDLSANFARLTSYLRDPGSNSPVANDDQLPTRGATWSFLRYAADQLYPADGDVWSRFDNSTVTGLGTLQAVFGGATDLSQLFQDWAVTNLLDDTGLSANARFAHRSWNFRNLFGQTFGSYDDTRTVFTPLGYPLAVAALADGVNARVRVRGLSASYYRLAVRGGREALLSFTSGLDAPSPSLQFILVRTK